jgi:hypothetical protein
MKDQYQEVLKKIQKIIKDVDKEDMGRWELERALEDIDDLICKLISEK